MNRGGNMVACVWTGLLAAILAADEIKEIQFVETTVVRFASPDKGREILTTDDVFTASLSRFDLQCRLNTNKEVQLADWKRFVVQHVRPWEKDEIETVTRSLKRLSKRLAGFQLPLPPVIRLVSTTGDEEAGAAYTRGTAIVLPSKVMKYQESQLDRLLAHELFHLLSRHDGAVRARLYGIIGFELCEPVELPRSLAPRRITNPDAPLSDCTIALTAANGKTFTGVPILYSQDMQYDAAAGKSLFQSLVFRLLVVKRSGGRWEPMLTNGEPVVIDPHKEPVFIDKVGKNTNYIIHPDEILADNFVRLVMQDVDVPTPRIIDEMRRVLAK
jgi:hypothetical protein